ncbi:MAG: alanine dehydrogenase [Bacteroidales bacterium]|nr:alanine dehydrogenase [Bacteroidales bacterium]
MAQVHDSSGFSFRQKQLFPQEEMLEIRKKSKQLLIGIPKEETENEKRIALTPQAVQLLCKLGHKILIQEGAGKGANYTDLEYSEAGAQIIDDRKKIFQSELILKISPFLKKDIDLLNNNQTLLSALHFSTQTKEQIYALMQKKVNAIAFEMIKEEPHYYPIVRSMSEIGGKLSINIAAEYLSKQHNGKGVLLGGITGISPAEVLIIGAGAAAEHAAHAALGLGALIKVFDFSIYKLREFQHNIGKQIFTSIIQPYAIKKALQSADVVIGALAVDEKKEQIIITEEMVRNMKKGTVIIDLNVDNGTCFETSKPTTHSNPVFEKYGIIHYCVPNIASRAARTASIALSNILAPIIIKIGNEGGIINLLKTNHGIRNGVYVFNGILTDPKTGHRFDINYKDIDLLMAAF